MSKEVGEMVRSRKVAAAAPTEGARREHVADRPGADPRPGCQKTAARGGEPDTAAGGTSPYARRGADRGGRSPRARPGSRARSSRPRVSDRVSVVLTVPAQPAQEFADILFSLRRDPFDPAFFKATITFPNALVASNNVGKQICCQVRPHCSWLPAAPSELLHPRDRPIPRG